MSNERDVTMRLKVAGDSRNGQAFADMAGAAQKVADNTKRAGQAVADLFREMNHVNRITAALKSMGVEAKAAGDAAARMLKDVGDGAKVGQREIDKLAAGMKAMGHAHADSGAAPKGILGRLSGLTDRAVHGAGSLGLPVNSALLRYGSMAAVGGLALSAGSEAVRTAERASHPEEGLTWQRFRREAGKTIQGGIESIPLIGGMAGALTRGLTGETQRREEERMLRESRQMVPYNQQRRAVVQHRRLAEEEIGTRQRHAAEFARDIPAARAQSEAITRRFTAQSEAAQDYARQTRRDPREAAAQAAFGESQAQLGVQQDLERKQLQSDIADTTAKVAQRQKEVEQATRAVLVAERDVSQQGISAEERERRRLNLQDQINAKNERLADLMRLQGQAAQQNDQKQRQTVQHSEQRAALMDQERGRLTGVIASEKEKIRGTKQSFGQLTKEERGRAARLAEKAQQGGKLNREDLQFLGGISGAEKLVGQQYERRADEDKSFQRFAAATDLNRPLQEAQQQRLQLENNIKVELDVNAKSIADQLQKELVPQLLQMLTNVKEGATTALQSQANQRRIQDNALATGGGK